MNRQEISPIQRMLNIWAISLIIWAVYRHQLETTLPIWLDEFVIKPMVFLIPMIHYIQKYEKVPVMKAIGFTRKNVSVDIFLGVFIGAAIFFAGAIANYLQFGVYVSPASTWLNEFSIWYLILIALASAITEEILMRGFVLKRFLEYKKQPIIAVLYSSILFFFLRIPMLLTIEALDGYMILQIMATDLFLSLAVGTLFVLRRNILLPILVHFFYTIGLFLFI